VVSALVEGQRKPRQRVGRGVHGDQHLREFDRGSLGRRTSRVFESGGAACFSTGRPRCGARYFTKTRPSVRAQVESRPILAVALAARERSPRFDIGPQFAEQLQIHIGRRVGVAR